MEPGLFQIDVLNVSFNITNSSCLPYNKPNSLILYVNNNSNHLQKVLKQLSETIKKRIIKLSNNEQSFNNVTSEYQKALISANYKENLKYDKNILSIKNNDKEI